MAQVLQNKSMATKFQILVEIAAAPTNIQQKDIAKKLNVTPQAISRYMEELVKECLVVSDGRSKHKVTREGIDWVLKVFRDLQSYSTFVKKAVTNMTVCTAVADYDLSRGQKVGLKMKGGVLLASDATGSEAKGMAVSDAIKGEDVGISDIEGIVPLEMGEVTILKVPGIQEGGSRRVDLTRLKKESSGKEMIGVIGIEALIALRKIGINPPYLYGTKEAVVEAACSGLPSLVVCVNDEIPGLLQRLGEEHLSYQLLDLQG
ncbi:MAG: winged helix-turn-helix transcriptional regulator [Dehalococcoidia bacterium]|nr:hypothetical protein [Chloroflexota bacterium]MBT9162411.1 hypothetical protein [Chloroflexota bacterium]